jgi:hydrogenase maturation protease
LNGILVAGVGSELRGDDAAGLLAARALRSMTPTGVDVEEHSGDAAALAESIGRHGIVVIVDAVAGDAPPGSVVGLITGSNRDRARLSSHAGGVSEAVELARALGQATGRAPQVRVIGIVGADFRLGASPQPAVKTAALEVARSLAAWLRETA